MSKFLAIYLAIALSKSLNIQPSFLPDILDKGGRWWKGKMHPTLRTTRPAAVVSTHF